MVPLIALLFCFTTFGQAAPDLPVFQEIRRLEALGKAYGLSTEFLHELPGHLKKFYLHGAVNQDLAAQLLEYVKSFPAPPPKAAPYLELENIYVAAARRKLPLGFFKALEDKKALRSVRLYAIEAQTASFDRTWNLIYLPAAQFKTNPEAWTASQWRSFYNECFHAYYDIVFTHEHLWDDAEALEGSPHRDLYRRHIAHYEKARPSAPLEAMEEAYSETVAAIAWLIASGVPEEKLGYKVGYTVEAVGHYAEGEEDPYGYTKAADTTYPSEVEYEFLFKALTGRAAPQR